MSWRFRALITLAALGAGGVLTACDNASALLVLAIDKDSDIPVVAKLVIDGAGGEKVLSGPLDWSAAPIRVGIYVTPAAGPIGAMHVSGFERADDADPIAEGLTDPGIVVHAGETKTVSVVLHRKAATSDAGTDGKPPVTDGASADRADAASVDLAGDAGADAATDARGLGGSGAGGSGMGGSGAGGSGTGGSGTGGSGTGGTGAGGSGAGGSGTGGSGTGGSGTGGSGTGGSGTGGSGLGGSGGGGGWQLIPSGVTTQLSGIWGSSPTNMWIVGSLGVVLHGDGTGWTPVSLGTVSTDQLSSIWGTGPNDVWIVESGASSIPALAAWHYDGVSWNKVAMAQPCYKVWGSGPNDYWVTGSSTSHFDGMSWTKTAQLLSGFTGIWGSGPDDVWMGRTPVGSMGNAAHKDASGWTPTNIDTGMYKGTINAFWGTRSDDVWAAGDNGSAGTMYHWNGASWTNDPSALSVTGTLTAVHGVASNDIWAVGSTDIYHYDGGSWSSRPAPAIPHSPLLQAVWQSGPNDAWAVGAYGVIIHWH